MRFLITAVLGAYAVAAIPGTSSPVVDMGVAVLRARAGCNAPGVVNGECGKVYDFEDCKGNEVWRIQPDVKPAPPPQPPPPLSPASSM